MSPRVKRWTFLISLMAVWGVASYVVVPLIWEEYFHRHPMRDEAPRVTRTADGHPGDPLNIALVGAESDLVRAMNAAGWYPADPITLASSVRIVVDSVLRRPDTEAPVSNLFLFGRRQDLAFEQPVGDSPRQRHHVRFWRWNRLEDDRPVWLGSATFDEGVGVSHTTGQVTHHIGPDIDAERNLIASELKKVGWERRVRWMNDFQTPREGTNGGGDPWRTDGRLATVVLQTNAVSAGVH